MKQIFFGIMLFLLLACALHGQAVSSDILEAPVPASQQFYDRDGNLLRSSLSKQDMYAQPVALQDISPWLVLATLAAEDRRFYQHAGLDGYAILRAIWQNIRRGGVVSGASTITQQLARSLYPRPKNWRSKWAEAWDALILERHYTKEQILEQYFNVLQFANQTQGVQAAARFYFGLPVSELSLSQSALLAGLIQAPSRLNPLHNPTGALARRNRVLAAMFKNGFITQEQLKLSLAEPLALQVSARPFSAPHFVRRVARLSVGHPHLYTTLDKDLQMYAEKAVRNHLNKLADHHVTNGAVVVLDNVSGEVLAYVGSADFYNKEQAGEVDGIAAHRQPGSTLKPFVYALALQNNFTAASILADEDTFFEGGFRPRNYDGKFHGNMSLRKALANSYNIPVIKAAQPLGVVRILQQLHLLGFSSLNRPAEFYGLGLALGGGEIILLELANAYATLARGGVIRPVVAARRPRIVLTTDTRRALPADISYIVTDILADNHARADAFGLNSPLYFPFPAAAKTGTSKDYKDNFAVGYTPRLTVAVWVGNFDASPMQKVSGITGAAPILHDVLSYAHDKYPSGNFERPADILTARICQQSGLLAGDNCPHSREEIFTKNTLPKTTCNGHHGSTEAPLQIIFPTEGDIYKYDPAVGKPAQAIHIQTVGATLPCQWRLNHRTLPQTEADFWWPLEKGKWDLSVQCGLQQARTHFTVL